ncbi:uncharacterized protein LOC125723464 isoform X5 [Brienomyrus brachyistius]|nr:uncharacterized protein LOC125723464 isoform X5 [Brienomyrus brachyistius]XP_048856059.1 uncharacterized protein LOC125723464 isoform X5 [Brienomyrus brachyistius]
MLSHDGALAPVVVRRSTRLSNREASGERSMSQQCTACSERPKTVNQGRHAVQSENSSINTPCYFPGNTTRKALSEIIGIKKCCTVNELDQATQFLGGKSDLDRGICTTMALRSKMPKNLSLSRVNRRNRFGETLLHLAVMDEDIHLVREILKIGACPSEADYAGWTPLHVAAAASHYDIVVTLLEAGAVVNFSGDKGVTPLHDAIESGNYKIVELLLSSGADPLQRTDDGRSALDMTMDATLRKLIERYQPKANQSSPGQCELWKWCCQDGSKVAKSALNSDARASSCSGGFSPKKIACNKNQESFGVEALLKCRDSMTAGDKDAVLSKPAIVFNKARNGQVIAEGTEEDGQDSDSTPAITADNEKEQSELSLSQNNESIIMCTEDLLGNLRNSDGNLVADGGEQFIHQISEDKAQECPESFTAYLEEAAACCRGRSQMKEQNDLQTNVDLEQHKDGKNETVRCDLNIKQNFGCQTAKPMRNPKIDPEDDANENMDECSISLLCPYARDSDLPCAPKAWHGLNACEGERLSTASNSTPSIKGSSSFSDGSTPSLLLEQSRSYDGISASDSCKTSTAELPVLQHEVSSFGEKYDIALSGRNSESFEIKKQSVEPLIARENKKNSTEVNQTLLEQQDNNRCEPTECMEHIEMAEMIRLLSDSELSNLSNPETPYPEKDALICVPVNVENFCNSLEDDCGALLALRGSGSCGSRALSQEKGCDITKWLLDSNTQVGSPKAIECVDLICQTIEDISQGAIEKAGLQCGQELLNQQAFSCQSEFHISGQVSENVVYDNSGSVSKKGLLESENNLSPHVVMSASENLLHDFSCSSSKSQPVCHDTQNDDENCSFDSDCTYVSESYFLKGTKTENLNNDSLNSGTSQDSSNKNFKRHSKKHHDKFGKGSDQQKGKLLQDNVSNVDSIYIREDCDPTNQSANILKSLPSGSDSINPVPCSGHQVQLRRKSASQRTCCMDHLTEVLPSKKRRSSKKFQSTSSTLDKVRKKQDEMLAMDLTDPEDTGKFTEAFAQIQTLLSDVLNKHKAENENLTRKYRIASDSFKHGTLREQLSSLSSRQKHLLDILQRQNNLRVRFQMFHSRSFEGQTTAEAPWTSMNVCDAETVHKTQWRDCRTGTLEQLSEDDCSGFSSALSLCSEAVSRNCSDQTQVTLGISHAGPQFSVNELRTDSCTFFDSFVNVDNQAGVPPSFTVQASPVAVHTENIQSQIKVPSELAYLIKQGTIKPGENVFRLKLKGNCHTASLQENGSIKDTGGQVYISPEQWIGSVLGPSVPMSPTYAWKKVTYRSKPLLGYVRKAGPVAGDSTASLQNCPSKATPPGDLLKEVCTESPIGDLMKIQTILLVSDSEFINNYELDQHWNRLLESDDWTI